MNLKLTSAELSLWPLLHGSLNLSKNVAAIRDSGLRAGSAANSFDYDRQLGRTSFVFLQPARVRGGYGLGDFVAIDPGVLRQPGVKGALWDVSDLLRQISRLLDDLDYELPAWIAEPGKLTSLASDCRAAAQSSVEQQGVPPHLHRILIPQRAEQFLIKSVPFREYFDRYYLSPSDYFESLAELYQEAGYGLDQFLERSHLATTAELLVPECVTPDHILGCRISGVWTQWRPATSPEIATRLDELVRRWAAAVT